MNANDTDYKPMWVEDIPKYLRFHITFGRNCGKVLAMQRFLHEQGKVETIRSVNGAKIQIIWKDQECNLPTKI